MKGSVRIGPEFFAKSKLDYADWTWALVREFLQNSIDCGSKTIKIAVSYSDPYTTVVVENDGEPMTQDILLNKLLSLGSSGKSFQGTVGGFGKAKELLYFCHHSYEIRTGTLYLSGSGADYSLTNEGLANFHGTTSKINIQGNCAALLEEMFARFISYAQVPQKFSVNGKPLEAKLHKGCPRTSFPFGTVYTSKQLKNSVIARVHGIPMFTVFTTFQGCVVIEIDKSENLTANRDGLKASFQHQLMTFVQELATNKSKALKPQTSYVRYEGGEFQITGVTPTDPEAFVNAGLAAYATQAQAGSTEIGNSSANPLKIKFTIKTEGPKVPAQYRPDSPQFSAYAHWLAITWARALVGSISRLGKGAESFSIGFIFSDDVRAQYERDNGQNIFYINPLLSKDKGKPAYKRNGPSRNSIIMSAVHEAVHSQGYMSHDEAYASALTQAGKSMLGWASSLQKELRQPVKRLPQEPGKKPATRATKQTLFGHAPTTILRWLGAKSACTFQEAKAGMERLGIAIADNTIRIQLGNGKKGVGYVPELTPEQEKELQGCVY